MRPRVTEETSVTIYYGPQSWFDEKIRSLDSTSLLEIVYERDERSRSIWHRIADGSSTPQGADEEDTEEHPENVAAESSDYASLNEHVISNFTGLVRSVGPDRLHLHNPPTQIHIHLERSFTVQIERYPYPSITSDVLRRVNAEWAIHLTGQDVTG
jgi:hypothetical protein